MKKKVKSFLGEAFRFVSTLRSFSLFTLPAEGGPLLMM
jgi:hypothetical protein